MPIKIVPAGDILADDADAIVVPVNTVGVMGKGLALQVARRYPSILSIYKAALRSKQLEIGKVYVVSHPLMILFPTKADWRKHSQLEYIQAGLVSLAEAIAKRGLRSVAVPALGCGLGGLDWHQVRAEIEAALASTSADIRLYTPKEGG